MRNTITFLLLLSKELPQFCSYPCINASIMGHDTQIQAYAKARKGKRQLAHSGIATKLNHMLGGMGTDNFLGDNNPALGLHSALLLLPLPNCPPSWDVQICLRVGTHCTECLKYGGCQPYSKEVTILQPKQQCHF